MAHDNSYLLNPNWPDACWDISGAFASDRELLLIHDFFDGHFGLKLFSLVHGAPLFVWNGGRAAPELLRTHEEISICAQAYDRRGIGMALTFSNLFLMTGHMESAMGNALLTLAETCNSSGLNAVILSSDILYDHVKSHYPSLRTVSSVMKVSYEKGAGNPDYYKALADRFDKVMVHPDDAVNFALLERLGDPDKFEIPVNENCVRRCPVRSMHCDSLSRKSLDFLGYEDNFETIRQKNGCARLETLLGAGEDGTARLSVKEMRTLYGMGFRHFKIQGKGLSNAGGLMFDLLDLVLRSDSADECSMTDLKASALEYLSLPTSTIS